MLQPVSVGLKFGFLAVLYLFLMWVAWSAIRDLRRGRGGPGDPGRAPASDETGMYEGRRTGRPGRVRAAPAGGARRRAPSGVAYDLMDGAMLGRGDVEIKLDDPFASSRHARISREGHVLVIEDLGSTNGTYLNEEPLSGPQPLYNGDRIRIGDSEFSYLQ